MRLGYFVLLLTKSADYRLEQGVCVTTTFGNDDFLQEVEEPVSLLPNARVCRAHVCGQSTYYHTQICVYKSPHI